MKIPNISATALNTFLECRLKYLLARLGGADGRKYTQAPSIALSRGTAIHKILEAYMLTGVWPHEHYPAGFETQVLVDSNTINSWVKPAVVQANTQALAEDIPHIVKHAILLMAIHRNEWGEDVGEIFFAGNNLQNIEELRRNTPLGNTMLEKRMDMTIQHLPTAEQWADGTMANATTDLLVVCGENAVIVDYKTGKCNTRFNAGELRQLRFCAAITFAHFPAVQSITAMTLHLLNSPGNHTIKVTRGDPHILNVQQEMREMRAVLDEYVRTQNEQLFPPTEGSLCKQYCEITECKHNGKRNNK